jgi:hypothetical protein
MKLESVAPIETRPIKERTMSVSGISSNNLLAQTLPPSQNSIDQFRKAFQQLGQDIQTGNLIAAQSDLPSLQGVDNRPISPAAPRTTNPLSQALIQLSQDLKAGDLPAAQKDYATAQKDLQSAAAVAHRHHHATTVDPAANLAQEFGQLGEALSGGNLSAAQQAFSLLGQDLPFAQDGSPLSGGASHANSFSLTA